MGKFYIGHVAYKGSSYYGWQKQLDVPTVQETLFQTLRGLYEFGRIDVKATSRTDRGVHALAQVVKFLIPRREEPEDVRLRLNEALPEDIYFTQLERINKSFKVTHLSLYKEYLYFFALKTVPFDFVGTIDEPLDLKAMQEAAGAYVGNHDFTLFQHRSQVGGGFKRQILHSEIILAEELFPEVFKGQEVYCFYVRGSGFLKQMVRLMMGSLINLGLSKISREGLEKALFDNKGSNQDGNGDYSGAPKKRPGFIVPGEGLFLKHIEFPEVFSGDQLRRVVDHEKYKDIFPDFFNGPNPQSFPIEIYKEELTP